MKKYTNSKDLNKDLKNNKIKKGETVWLDETTGKSLAGIKMLKYIREKLDSQNPEVL